MKPHRIRMAHNLLLNYGLYRKMEIYRPSSASFEELCKFHSEDYVRFLRTITPDNMGEHTKQMQRFNVGEDCPVFDGLYQFCQASSGGSIGGAVKLNKGHADIAINWAGPNAADVELGRLPKSPSHSHARRERREQKARLVGATEGAHVEL